MSDASAKPVLVVDFGAQYAQLIARRVREAQVYSEVVPHTETVKEMVARDPSAIILSGGPATRASRMRNSQHHAAYATSVAPGPGHVKSRRASSRGSRPA
ncbi:hypothetical protein ACFQ1S_44225, partial [Kibdelosporangium lantanae]